MYPGDRPAWRDRIERIKMVMLHISGKMAVNMLSDQCNPLEDFVTREVYSSYNSAANES